MQVIDVIVGVETRFRMGGSWMDGWMDGVGSGDFVVASGRRIT